MTPYTSLGYKDFWTKVVVIIHSLIVLGMLGYLPFLYLQEWEIPILYLLWVIVLGLLFYMIIRLLNNLKYEFQENWIQLTLPSWKTYFLEKENISRMEEIGRLPRYYSFGIRYNFITQEIMFTTSLNNAYRIVMEDGRYIIITPRKIDQNVVEYYNN